MLNLFEKNEFSQKDLEELIQFETEESIHLDFKSAAALDKSDNKKKEISKDISSFANSDGGLIIYGIDEKDHKAKSLSPIDGHTYTKEWLEQLINTTIQRKIEGIRIFPVRVDSKIDQSIYVVKVPKSMDSPHMARDKRYYKRYNFESVMMEEYEVREAFGRTVKSELGLMGLTFHELSEDNRDYQHGRFNMKVIITIGNFGDKAEKDYKLNFYLEEVNKHLSIIWNSNAEKYHDTQYDNGRVKISSYENPTIYPEERIDIMKVVISIDYDEVLELLPKLKFEVRLYYSNQEDRMNGDFLEFFHKSFPNLKE